ncbi:uncharacterized protein EAE98_003104 [Botrytis deweyae]|uniref:Uncharacterized protein n=2 Tax=Botrytis TaxID=33196 RepID=A0A4Z1JPS5_9HELO|nr:uncharacterized protein EAE98_003104 [Botrytis deweyae]KAF7918654.1 hypothetical protein EAE99_008848 [Botrytis elliptica]KAF7935059.1 hypothetical protein EAE98_003104 [Botrytis deweyae]TGO75476.1 hypothetical protein BELL_0211g00130 [Botrytis elliptica]
MSCIDPSITLFPVLVLAGSDDYVNACTAGNITSNSAAVSAMTKCCGSAPVNVILEGCYSYCNVTSSADQQAFEQCFGSSDGITPDVDYGCTLDDASGHEVPGSGTITPSSTGTSAQIATLVPITVTTSSGAATTTATSGQATATAAANSTSTSASGTEKPSTTSKTSASASSSAATPSTTANAGPTVKQFSKGAIAVIALAFARLLI